MTEDRFTSFVEQVEPRLRRALVAAFGPERGRDAAAEALAYGWEHWDRIAAMANPAGYLYRVGRDRGRRMTASPPLLPPTERVHTDRWVEPRLPDELSLLSEQQRVVVALLYGYEWSMSEVAELLEVSKGTVQSYAKRGLAHLREGLGVER